jgi:hypothetical protein
MMMMNVEQSVERELAGETKVLGGSLSQCHSVHLKSHEVQKERSNLVETFESVVQNSSASV